MKLRERKLKNVNWSADTKRLFWAICCVAWAGSFRIHEILSKEATSYDLQSTLLWKDIQKDTVDVDGKWTIVSSFFLKFPKMD